MVGWTLVREGMGECVPVLCLCVALCLSVACAAGAGVCLRMGVCGRPCRCVSWLWRAREECCPYPLRDTGTVWYVSGIGKDAGRKVKVPHRKPLEN